MTDHIQITGVIGTEPELRVVGNNLSRMTMRVATSERRRDSNGDWRNQHTNWYSVTAFGKLAENAHASLSKGQRILCHGKLRVQHYDRDDGGRGTRIEILANNLGPDLVNQRTVSDAKPATVEPSQPDSVVGVAAEPSEWAAPIGVNDAALAANQPYASADVAQPALEPAI